MKVLGISFPGKKIFVALLGAEILEFEELLTYLPTGLTEGGGMGGGGCKKASKWPKKIRFGFSSGYGIVSLRCFRWVGQRGIHFIRGEG